jgi:O-antigen/teichoic acid export membrane protein
MEKAPCNPSLSSINDVVVVQATRPPENESQKISRELIIAAKGGGLSFAGRLFEYAVRFVFSIIIARAIGVEHFGLYTLGLTVAMIASNLCMLGLHTGMVRFLPPAIRDKDEPRIWGIIQVGFGLPAILSLILGAGLFLLADSLANLGFHDPRLAPVFRLVSLIIPMDTIVFMAYTVTISYKRPEYNVIAHNVAAPLVKLFLTIAALVTGLSFVGILIAQIAGSAVGLILLVYFANSLFSLRRPWQKAQRNTGQLLRYSLPVHMGWMVNMVRGTLETIILGIFGLTSGVGIYAATARLSNVGNMFYLSVGNISTPIIADLYSRGESGPLKVYYQTTTRWLLMFNLPLFVSFAIFARPLISIFGEDFAAGTTALIILAFGTLVFTATGLGANTLDMTDHPKVNTANSFVMVGITLGLNLLLIPNWGVVGAATAASLSAVLINMLCLLEVWYLVGMHPYNRTFLKPLLAGLTAGGVAYLFNVNLALPLLLQLALGGAVLWGVYALALVGLGLSPDDIMLVNTVWYRIRQLAPYRRRAV